MMYKGVSKHGVGDFDSDFGLDNFGVFILAILDRNHLVQLQRELAAHLGVGKLVARLVGANIVAEVEVPALLLEMRDGTV